MKKRLIVFWATALVCICVGCKSAENSQVETTCEELSSAYSELDETSASAENSQIKTICEEFFTAYSGLDGETVGGLISGNDESISFSELQGAISKHVSAEIKSVTEEENTAKASAVVQNVDVAEVFANVPETISSKDEAKTYLIEAFSKDDVPMTEFNVELLLVKQNDDWRIQMTPELSDALLGGYNTFVDAMLEKVVE